MVHWLTLHTSTAWDMGSIPGQETEILYATLLLLLSRFSCVWLFVTPWTVSRQAPLSMGFPSKKTGVGCHFLLQRIFPIQGSDRTHVSCASCTGRWILDQWATWEAPVCLQLCANWWSIRAKHLLFLCFGSRIFSKNVFYSRESNDVTSVKIKEKFNNTILGEGRHRAVEWVKHVCALSLFEAE